MTRPDETRHAAISAHGQAWALVEKADRTEAETARMIGVGIHST
jgi:hypothetical protein